MKNIFYFFSSLFILLFLAGSMCADTKKNVPVTIPEMVKITATVRKAPPVWAVMQRHLIKTIEEAAPLYLDKYTYRGGTMREHQKLDDDYECFINWPLFYIIGGDDKFLDWGLRQYNAITRQWTYQHQKSVHNEFVKHYDMLHLSEGYVGFQYFGLADPTIPENINRARRYAGFYLNEDPDAPNFDPKYKIIRSIETGSKGPVDHMDCGYIIKYNHASLYPFMKNIRADWDKDPELSKKIQKLFDEIVVPCDAVNNLAVTGLVTHAYLLTGDDKYKKWVLEYVDAWMKRIEENKGIIPDNIGRTGKIGEYRNGQWWGGFFGWSTRYGIEIMFKALVTASECAHLISGDPGYLDLLRSQVDVLLDRAQMKDGNLLVPYRYGPDGWYDYRPMEPFILSHLWHDSLDSKDRERIERIRKGKKSGPWAYAYALSPDPPAPGSEMWKPDGTLFDWNKVLNDVIINEHRRNETPHLSFLGGTNPKWPERILQAEYEQVCRIVHWLRTDTQGTDRRTRNIRARNPVLTNGLAQMTMGAPFTSFNGGLLRAGVRYFDIDRARPGLPLDAAALVKKLGSNRTILELVNTSAFETRNLTVQAGAYGEHEFTEVRFKNQTKDKNGNIVSIEKTIPVNNKFFTVELPPSTSIELEIGVRRFVNKPGYAFPWHN